MYENGVNGQPFALFLCVFGYKNKIFSRIWLKHLFKSFFVEKYYCNFLTLKGTIKQSIFEGTDTVWNRPTNTAFLFYVSNKSSEWELIGFDTRNAIQSIPSCAKNKCFHYKNQINLIISKENLYIPNIFRNFAR